VRARAIATAAIAGVLVSASGALAGVHLSSGSAYTGKSNACPHPKLAGTTCVFKFRASRNGYGLRFVGKTVVSSWACRQGGGQALLGGKVSGNDPLPLLVLGSDGKLQGRAGRGPTRVTAVGHIAEAGTKVVVRFHLAHQHCVTPKITLIEGLIPGSH
jgi:hypothetical protein